MITLRKACRRLAICLLPTLAPPLMYALEAQAQSAATPAGAPDTTLTAPQLPEGTRALPAATPALTPAPRLIDSDWNQRLRSLQNTDPASALQGLLDLEALYADQADYHYWRAIYMLANEHALEAVSLQLERALMLDPNHAGALYDYGLIQCRLGEEASCHNILREAQRRFGTPPLAQQSPAAPSLIKGQLRVGLGQTSNYNHAGSVSNIPLLIGGETIIVELAEEERPKSAAYYWYSLELSLRQPQLPWLEVRAGLHSRDPLTHGDQLSRRDNAAIDLLWHAGPTHHYALHYQIIRDRKLGNLELQGLRWRHAPQWAVQGRQAAWIFSTGFDRRRPEKPNAHYNTLLAQLRHVRQLSPGSRLDLVLVGERDLPENKRPGQAQNRYHIIAALEYPSLLPGRGELRFMLRLASIQDSAAYSPIFGSTRRRSTQSEAAIAAAWPLTKRTDLQLELRGFQERSNLPLFRQRETQLNLSLGYTF